MTKSRRPRPPGQAPKRPTTGTDTRRKTAPIPVWVLPEEREAIARHAAAAGLPLSAYLRAVGLGSQPPSVVDLDQVKALSKVNADLGRLGGLLKLWLSRDGRFAIPGAPGRGDVTDLLDVIRATEERLDDVVRAILARF